MREEHLEAKEGLRPPLGRLILARLHWGALGVAVGLWVLWALGLLLAPDPRLEATVRDMRSSREKLLERMQGASIDVEEEARVFEETAARVRAGFAPPPPGREPGPDVTYSAPLLDLVREGARNEILFLPPSDLQLDVRMGAIALSWVPDGDNNVAISGWEVLRQTGNEPAVVVATLPADTTTWVDDKVQAGVSYTYRVRALTDDPTIPPGARTSQPGPARRAEAASDVRVTLLAGDAAKRTARIEVEKWHDGAWSRRPFEVKVGEKIGAPDPVSGIDYSTGLVLKSLKSRVVKETRKVQEVTFDARGKVILRDGAPVLEEVPVTEESLVIEALVEGGALPPKTLEHRQKR